MSSDGAIGIYRRKKYRLSEPAAPPNTSTTKGRPATTKQQQNKKRPNNKQTNERTNHDKSTIPEEQSRVFFETALYHALDGPNKETQHSQTHERTRARVRVRGKPNTPHKRRPATTVLVSAVVVGSAHIVTVVSRIESFRRLKTGTRTTAIDHHQGIS